MSTKKLWGGRFQEQAAAWVDAFGASISFDQLMAEEDIEGSLAHVKMLKATGILNADDSDQIIAGLEGIQTDLEAGKLNFTVENEDIHMNIEAILTDRIGAVAGKLHTGRSRNDQVATDFHLYLKKRLPKIIDELTTIQKNIGQDGLRKRRDHYARVHAFTTRTTHLIWALSDGVLPNV